MKGEKGKAPAIQWYYKDWLSDRKLQLASASTRGIWMNILMYMIDCSLDGEECEHGELANLDIDKITRLGSCSKPEAELFIEESLELKFCDICVTRHGVVSVMSRRLKRDEKNRRDARRRKREQREREVQKQGVTEKSQKSPSPSPFPTPSPINKSRFAGIEKQLERIAKRWPKVYQWTTQMLKHNKNKEAIKHVLNRIEATKNIDDYFGFCTKIMGVENGNYNEQEFRTQEAQKQQERLKQHLDNIGEKI